MLRYGWNSEIKSATKIYTGSRDEIPPQPHIRCLGVYLSEDCTFQHHIATTANKARAMTEWILRTFATRDPDTMLTLWRALVQPILDYCSQLWSPHKKEVQQLEKVQRSFTRHIRGMGGLTYWERLQVLGLYSQQRRRDRYRTIYTWKILEQQVPNPTLDALKPYTNIRTGRKCVRRSLPSTAPERVKTLLAASLAYQGSQIFNTLPKEVREVTICGVEKFKTALDKFLKTVPDEPPVPGYTARGRTSNSLPDQVSLSMRDARDGSSSGPPRL